MEDVDEVAHVGLARPGRSRIAFRTVLSLPSAPIRYSARTVLVSPPVVGDDRRGHAVLVLLETGHLEAVAEIRNVVSLGAVAQDRLRHVLRAAKPGHRALGLRCRVVGLDRLGAAELLTGERGGPHHAIAELPRNAPPAHLVLGPPQPQELGRALHDADGLGVLERARVLVDEYRRNAEMREC